jgi:Multimeric flavodoxin WrbA
MKVLAVNGSPRKAWNTATLLNEALRGAAANGAETELIHLYDLNFKGCTSCFSCKRKNSDNYGRCGYIDELTPVLNRIPEVDALILGSPIYIATITGEMKCFLERLIFPYLVYDKARSSLLSKKLPVATIYTAGAPEEGLKLMGVDKQINQIQGILERIIGPTESLLASDTYQFDDYSKYVNSFDVEAKTQRRNEVFPVDRKKAFEMGARLVNKKRS